MQSIKEHDWQALPAQAQQEVYDFFVFVKQRYEQQTQQATDTSETLALANHSANQIEEWLTDQEDEIWS